MIPISAIDNPMSGLDQIEMRREIDYLRYLAHRDHRMSCDDANNPPRCDCPCRPGNAEIDRQADKILRLLGIS